MAAIATDWITYAAARGLVIVDEPATAQALVRGQDYITYHYVNRFGSYVEADEAILDAAVYEAAALELTTPGFWSKTYTADQQKVLTKVGEIEWTVRGDASGAEAATPVSTKIEAMLRPYMWCLPAAFVV